MTGNKEIAKNTVFLYIRMLFIMAVSLYSSRVVLNILGASDYGLYNVVGGVVAMLSFINGAASSGTSRFLTFYLGKEDNYNYQQVFSAAFYIHLGIAFIIFILGETAGLWFVNNKLIIEPGREEAALFVYHLSLITCFVTFTQVPYNASLIAHEKMDIYAYIGIVEAVLKLGILLVLKQSHYDKLKTYAILLLTISILIALFYRFYCHHLYKECRLVRVKNKKTVKNLIVYSSWDMYGNLSSIAQTQGINIVINMFLATVVNAARGIAYQVDAAVNNFISNFLTAVNPQIVKQYAAGNKEGSKSLLLSSTKYSFYLMLALSLPICLTAEPLLHLWLGTVPEYATIFLQLAIITSLFQVFDTSFYTALYAKGRIRENALISPVIGFLVLPVSYIFFRTGSSPVVLAVVMLVFYAVLGLVVKPILIIKIAGYTWTDIKAVFIPCLKVLLSSIVIPIGVYCYIDNNNVINALLIVLLSIFSVGAFTWLLGIDSITRIKILEFVGKKLRFKK